MLDPHEGEDILDMCAAPGSKTTHICALTKNNAKIIANDSDMARVGSIRNVLEQFGAKAKVSLNEGQIFGRRYPEYFDKILLDAPCSGEGLIYLNGQKPLRHWSIKKVRISSIIQKELISSAFEALKKGGTLIYSTCTLEPDENEGVVSYLLETYKDARIEKISLPGTNKGITKWSGNRYHQEVAKTMRILPSAEMMGFYVAKIKKV
jgi:16S rRNA (cytosine1407-C5)-methyltransferase